MAAKKYSPRLTPIASAVHAILVGASVASGGSVTVRSAHAALVGLCATATEAAAEEARSRGARWSPTSSRPADLCSPSQALPITPFAEHGSLTLAYEAELAEEKAAEGGTETGFIVLDPITVEGQATGDAGYASGVASSATRLPEAILDTTKAVNVVPQSVIEDRAILDPQEAIQNVSGVQRGATRTGVGEPQYFTWAHGHMIPGGLVQEPGSIDAKTPKNGRSGSRPAATPTPSMAIPMSSPTYVAVPLPSMKHRKPGHRATQRRSG